MKNPKKTYGKAFLLALVLSITAVSTINNYPAIAGFSLALAILSMCVPTGFMNIGIFAIFAISPYFIPRQDLIQFTYMWYAFTFSLGMLYLATEKKTTA
ncbi:MAG: hypothetical protein WCJ51_01550 [Candidatus Moraniibacteriota bacterium]